MQGCRLFKWSQNLPPWHNWAGVLKRCRNLPPGHCVAGVQAVLVVSGPSSLALFGRGAGCLSGVGTYIPGTVEQGCRLFKLCQNLPTGH